MPYLLDLYEKLYNAELARKQNIDSSVSLLSGLLTAEIGFLAYMIQNLLRWKIEALYIAYYSCFGGALILFGVAVYYFFRSITGFKYGYISTPDEIDHYRKKYLEFVSGFGTKDIDGSSVLEIQDMLTEQYSTYASINTSTNDRKVHFQRRVKLFVVVSLSILFATFVIYKIVRYYDPIEVIQKVQIVTGN
jgi:hypothetical protein